MENFLPISPQEVKERNWDYVDVVLITPDAYIDHPSFAMAIIGRVIESLGFRVAILSQPNWKDLNEFKKFGKPRLCFAISGGNMDSMINKYTHNRKPRKEDEYSPGGKPNLRPDRATIVYSNMVKAVYPDVFVIIGGIEATMRRFVHYDWWQDKLRKPILLDSKADLLIYGMGEKTLKDVLTKLDNEKNIKNIKDIRGTAYILKGKEIESFIKNTKDFIELPSYEEIEKNKTLFSEMTKIIYNNLNPYCSKIILQKADTRAVVVNSPQFPLTQEELDSIYELPYTYLPHPYYKEKIPAFETIKNSFVIHRGCFGGCSFCSLYYHQGKFIQSRSIKSILKEISKRANNSKITITDLGGPTANMYMMKGRNFELCKKCKKISCIYPSICKNLNIDHTPLIELINTVYNNEKVKNLFISSGIRMDLAINCPKYIELVSTKHTSGYLKVAPEHTHTYILKLMKKPPIETFIKFTKLFKEYSTQANKKQFIIPYFISAFPGTTLNDAIDMAIFLKTHNIKALQINDFLPAPGEYATSMYFTESDPETGEKLYIPKNSLERKIHRALIQYFKKENFPLIFKALKTTGRINLLKFFKFIK
ncbi:MAG: YgiQ family radical SAM protein [Elusimicrobiales bacterium]|nr:YgiQ family radical SAM protein [Elusimicrobiales bacterium]